MANPKAPQIGNTTAVTAADGGRTQSVQPAITKNGEQHGTDALTKARAARKPADPNESKAAKFRRLAMHRMPRLIRQLQNIGALANRSAYEFTDEQAKKITDTIADELDSIRKRFAGTKTEVAGWSL